MFFNSIYFIIITFLNVIFIFNKKRLFKVEKQLRFLWKICLKLNCSLPTVAVFSATWYNCLLLILFLAFFTILWLWNYPRYLVFFVSVLYCLFRKISNKFWEQVFDLKVFGFKNIKISSKYHLLGQKKHLKTINKGTFFRKKGRQRRQKQRNHIFPMFWNKHFSKNLWKWRSFYHQISWRFLRLEIPFHSCLHPTSCHMKRKMFIITPAWPHSYSATLRRLVTRLHPPK